MSNFLAPIVRRHDGGFVVVTGTGPAVGATPYMGLLVDASGAVFATSTISIDHHHNAMPFDVDGRLVVEDAPVVRWDQGVPFTANNAVGVSALSADHVDQGVQFTPESLISSVGGYVPPLDPRHSFYINFTEGSLGPFTHTRASVANHIADTGLVTALAVDEAGLSSRGVQLEAAATNVSGRAALVADWAVSSGGTLALATSSSGPAVGFTEDATNVAHTFRSRSPQGNIASSGGTSWCSMLISKGDVQYVNVSYKDQSNNGLWVMIDTDTMTIEEGPTNVGSCVTSTATVESIAGGLEGLVRLSFVTTISNAEGYINVTGTYPGGGATPSYLGTGSYMCAVLMNTIEYSVNFPGSLITPVTGASSSRSSTVLTAPMSDLPGLPGAGLTNDFCGQIVVDLTSTDNNDLMSINAAGDANNRLRIYIVGGSITFRCIYGGTSQAITGPVAVLGARDIRFKWTTGACAIWVNGTKYSGAIGGNAASAMDTLVVGGSYTPGSEGNGNYKLIRLVPQALSDSQIEAW